MIIKNYTPHTVNFLNDRNEVILEVPSSGIARAAQSRITVGAINGIPVNKSSFGQVENLPEPEEGVILVVSALTAQACPSVATSISRTMLSVMRQAESSDAVLAHV